MKNVAQTLFIFAFAGIFLLSCNKTFPPQPLQPLPSERQLAWHELGFYAFVHFNMNTFTNMEWGMGSESPELFNPTELDCRQWARVCRNAGMKGIILTAKHHDGFCLWPSAYTEHSVKNSPWKNGKGDVVRELADACREYDLKMGIYLSPWDRNHPDYGKPEYISYFRNQLRELLTNYGDVFEVWFDGANGGTGYYGGANEERRIDRETYYDWENTRKIVRDLQPMACMFSDAGPDIRWVGNEEGWAMETNWATIRRDEYYPGTPDYADLRTGQEDGTHWVPAEVDVSIRPGWFYHPSEDHQVKTLPQLLDIYYHSIGRNASLLVNFPVDTRGLIHEKDAEQIQKLADAIKADFAVDLAKYRSVSASNFRGNSRKYKAENVSDGNPETSWATDDSVTRASLLIDFYQPTGMNRFLVQEDIRLGQRVKEFMLEAFVDEQWIQIAHETTIGRKRILRFPNITTDKLRFIIADSKAAPVISNIEVFNAPKVLIEPVIQRGKEGMVTMSAFDNALTIYYTLDGSEPDQENVAAIIDGKENTAWSTDGDRPHEFIIDLGEELNCMGFKYLPDQGRWNPGIIFNYEFYVSSDGKNWGTPVSTGEFSNIQNSPVWQTRVVEPVHCRYIKLKAVSPAQENGRIGMAEFEIITQ